MIPFFSDTDDNQYRGGGVMMMLPPFYHKYQAAAQLESLSTYTLNEALS